MRKFGLIGYPLGHSFSKSYFTQKFNNELLANCVYENYPIEKIEKVIDLVNQVKDLSGLNVTIPYKEKVMLILDELDDEAAIIGAVNTIKIERLSGKINLKGFNTDLYGFIGPLISVLKPIHNKALILGTGGASKAVAYAFKKWKISHTYVSRNPKTPDILAYSNLTPDLIEKYKIIVNTTPVGMYPNIDSFPGIPYEALTSDHILYDLVYNPEKTAFLKKGEKHNTIILNGLPMLHLQAEKAWEIWNR